MAVFKISFMTLALFLLAGILFSGDIFVSGETCKGGSKLIAQCLRYVQKPGPKIRPSKGCCDAIKKADIPCACRNLKRGGGSVSVEKVAYVLETCGYRLKPGTKCGG